MRALMRHVSSAAGVIAASTALFLIAPNMASAQNLVAAGHPCGYDGYAGSNGSQPLYTH
jgi:hypothetical protein